MWVLLGLVMDGARFVRTDRAGEYATEQACEAAKAAMSADPVVERCKGSQFRTQYVCVEVE